MLHLGGADPEGQRAKRALELSRAQVAALISAIYVFSQMASQSEFTIFRVAGLDTRRAQLSLFTVTGQLTEHEGRYYINNAG